MSFSPRLLTEQYNFVSASLSKVTQLPKGIETVQGEQIVPISTGSVMLQFLLFWEFGWLTSDD
jgi:hypothetical protein